MSVELATKVEATPCPSCGRKTLMYFLDPLGDGGQCGSLDCLQMFDFDELPQAPAHANP